jgi:hypothetical protein
MKICDYCGKEIPKPAFCNKAHLMAFKRGGELKRVASPSGSGPIKEVVHTKIKTAPELKEEDIVDRTAKIRIATKVAREKAESKGFSICEHGAMKGLCKLGCK